MTMNLPMDLEEVNNPDNTRAMSRVGVREVAALVEGSAPGKNHLHRPAKDPPVTRHMFHVRER